MQKIPVIYSDIFLTDYRTVDCESPDRVTEIYYDIKGMADFIEPEPCTDSDLRLCHTERIIELVRKSDAYNAASLAVGGAIKAAEVALATPSFALVRPPGHHAGRDFNGGFCFFNNMAIAMKRLLRDGKIERVLIIDIDLHYGNGTEDIVRGDKGISFWNVDGATRDEFFRDLEGAVRIASGFDIVGCSAGFDTYIKDWGGLLNTGDFRRVGAMIASSNRRFFSILEGGYYIPDLGINVRAYMEGIQEVM
ncbi:MAG: acetylpolyamine aminohydrolase [Syntrophus sp. (in: bacteria)]|nr:acetylpolyamine aminohydrolase [Syntrophus sp. (in: bacteria)]